MSFAPGWSPAATWADYIGVIDFPRNLLPKLREAIDNGEATWVRQTLNNDQSMSYYEWNGCLFVIGEIRTNVFSVRLVEWMCDTEQNSISKFET